MNHKSSWLTTHKSRLPFWLFLILCACSGVIIADEPASHLRLIDPLDRPQDGYCVDIVGTPGYLRSDLPLFAHNCKPALTIDSAVVFTTDGLIRFSETDLCITVAGINNRALPGTPVLLHRCGSNSTFFDTDTLQKFTLHADGKLELDSSGLCLTVGRESATTYSAADKWRPLFVETCSAATPALSRWRFQQPG